MSESYGGFNSGCPAARLERLQRSSPGLPRVPAGRALDEPIEANALSVKFLDV
jgi:hypothetical protein